mgnify:CR=1 FL=1
MTQSLAGKSALVTGSTGGIGRATAQLLAERGAHVVVTGVDAEGGEQAAAAIRAAGGKADWVLADLSAVAGVRDLAAAATRLTGGIDILVNNAGRFPLVPSDDTTEELFNQVYDVNVRAPFFLTTALVLHMAARGAGVVVNIGSFVSSKGIPGATCYASSKAALDQLTRIWAAEYGPAGVRVNTVVPGQVATEGVAAAMAALTCRTPRPAGSAGRRRSPQPWPTSPRTRPPS